MITESDFLSIFGGAIRARRAAVFVGAGVSQSSGLPSWDQLMAPLRDAADVPSTVTDPTVVAEYARQELDENVVERLILQELKRSASASPSDALIQLLTIDVADIWTTNFDTLIEDAAPTLEKIIVEDDYQNAQSPFAHRLTKLHGSLTRAPDGELSWKDRPVFTRSDFEQFERRHPLKWAMLRAQFLTSSFLFLGFSFSDPNISALMKIVRSLPTDIQRLPHFAVMKKPTEKDELREFELFSKDLEHSGIRAVAVDEFAEIPSLLRRLGRHALPPNLFVAGDGKGNDQTAAVLESMGAVLTQLPDDLSILSFDGKSARAVAEGYKASRGPDGYSAERIRAYYRKSPNGDRSIDVARFGTAVFTDLPLDDMRSQVMKDVRALLVIGSGGRTLEESRLAQTLDIPVVPLAMSGPSAREIWESGAEQCGFGPEHEHDWQMLADGNPAAATQAAVRLLESALGSTALGSR